MKSKLLLILLMSFAFKTYSQDIKGYDGINLLISTEELQKTLTTKGATNIKTTKNKVSVYSYGEIEGKKPYSILYEFNNNKLGVITYTINSQKETKEELFNNIKKRLENTYGNTVFEQNGLAVWESGENEIEMSYIISTEKIMIAFANKTLKDKIINYDLLN